MKHFFAFLLIFLSACETAPTIEAGQISGLTYTNLSLGIALDMPEGWSIISDAETFKLVNKQAVPEAQLHAKWLEATAKPLVSCYKYRDSDFEDQQDVYVNPNITVITEFIPNRLGIKSTEEYVPYLIETITNDHQMEYKHVTEGTFQMNEFVFQTVSYEFDLFEKKIQKKTYLYKWGKQLINVTLTWEAGDEKTFQDLTKSFLSLRFKSKS
jgi:hypothetical protein